MISRRRKRFGFLGPDRGSKFTSGSDAIFASIGVEAIKIPVRSPRANAFAERFVRTVRTECLDHLLICSRRHLEATVREYLRHYNQARPHRSFDLAQPIPKPAPPAGNTINQRDVLGGNIGEYDLAARAFAERRPGRAPKTTGASPDERRARGSRPASWSSPRALVRPRHGALARPFGLDAVRTRRRQRRVSGPFRVAVGAGREESLPLFFCGSTLGIPDDR